MKTESGLGLRAKMWQVKKAYNYGRMGGDIGLLVSAITVGSIAVQLGAKDESYIIKGCEYTMMYAASDFMQRYRENDRLYLTWGV